MTKCTYFQKFWRHIYLPYRIEKTGETGMSCYGCGKKQWN